MAFVPLVDRDTATGQVKQQLDQIHEAFGTVPAMFAATANSPAALQSMWGSFGAFAEGSLGAALTEQIAVAVADHNSCHYCLSAHTALGKQAGLSEEELAAAQLGESDDAAVAALLGFAIKIVQERGQVTEADKNALSEHGWSDEQIVETFAQVALNIFTNYLNIGLDVPVDFPAVAMRSGV